MKGLAAEIGFERSNVEYCGLKINYSSAHVLGKRGMWYIVEFLAMTTLSTFCAVFAFIIVCEDKCLSSFDKLDIAFSYRRR